jgi:hypothetical protein
MIGVSEAAAANWPAATARFIYAMRCGAGSVWVGFNVSKCHATLLSQLMTLVTAGRII